MDFSRLKKKYGFTDENLSRIKQAVEQAENGTEGELVVAVTPSSSLYTAWELLFALFFSFFSLALMIVFSSGIENCLRNIFWQVNTYSIPLFMMVVMCVVFVLAFLFANLPFMDRLIVKRRLMNRFVYSKALKQFVVSDVYSTKKRTGVLIFVSILERNVQVVCDKGVLECSEQSEWDKIAGELAIGFKQKSPTDSIVAAVEKCGAIFKKNFPLDEAAIPENELPDGIVFIEGGEI